VLRAAQGRKLLTSANDWFVLRAAQGRKLLTSAKDCFVLRAAQGRKLLTSAKEETNQPCKSSTGRMVLVLVLPVPVLLLLLEVGGGVKCLKTTRSPSTVVEYRSLFNSSCCAVQLYLAFQWVRISSVT
jgi:hypothetical protein